MEGKQMGVVPDMPFLYIVFNCIMGSFACFWSPSHYLCKWALCVIIKCSSAVEKCKWIGQTEQQVLVVPHGHAKPGSDSEATKETAPIVIPGEEHFIFVSALLLQNIINYFTLFCTVQGVGIPALVKNKIKQCCSTDWLSLSVTIKMCDFKNAIHCTESVWYVINITQCLCLKVGKYCTKWCFVFP